MTTGLQEFEGGDVRFGSVSDLASLRDVAFAEPVDVVVSCLASRTGGKVRLSTTGAGSLAWLASWTSMHAGPEDFLRYHTRRDLYRVCVC